MSKPIVQCLADDLDAVVDKYREQGISVAESVGAIELVKFDLIQVQVDSNDEAIRDDF